MASCCSSYTAPAYIWAFLSILAAITCPFGLYFSNWLEIQHGELVSSVSSFRMCSNVTLFSVSCDTYLSFDEMYTDAWRAVTLMFGVGSCLLILVALTAIFGFCVKHLFNIVVTVITVIAQGLGALLFAAGILTFPVGWSAEQVKALCGSSSDLYNPGMCSIGWAFYVIIGGTAVALLAASMSWTAGRKRKKDREPSFAI